MCVCVCVSAGRQLLTFDAGEPPPPGRPDEVTEAALCLTVRHSQPLVNRHTASSAVTVRSVRGHRQISQKSPSAQSEVTIRSPSEIRGHCQVSRQSGLLSGHPEVTVRSGGIVSPVRSLTAADRWKSPSGQTSRLCVRGGG